MFPPKKTFFRLSQIRSVAFQTESRFCGDGSLGGEGGRVRAGKKLVMRSMTSRDNSKVFFQLGEKQVLYSVFDKPKRPPFCAKNVIVSLVFQKVPTRNPGTPFSDLGELFFLSLLLVG